jgi:hypothetical protein
MPWRGPEVPGEFPSLGYQVIDWIEDSCAVPDRHIAGQPLRLTDWQKLHLLWEYRLWPDAEFDPDRPSAPFVYFGNYLVKPQKALALDTPIATPSGWTTMGSVRVGDHVFDESGTPTRVLRKSQVWESETYRVTFSDGASLVACGDHEWVVDRRTSSSMYVRETVTTSAMVGDLVDAGGARKYRVPVAEPLRLPVVDLPVDPYVMGAWLGDGETEGGRLTGIDRQVFDEIEAAGYRVRQENHKRWGVYGLKAHLRGAGVLGNKHIPSAYLRASESQRWALLQGLMDTDGHADARQGKCEFTTTKPALRDGMRELLYSLGIKHVCYAGDARLNGRRTGPKWRISFAARSDMPVFRLVRKQARLRCPKRGHAQFRHRRVVSVERIPTVPTQCLMVEAESHVFLAGREMIPTRNSGKGPMSAARICAQAEGPVLFAGWDAYGEPVGMPWATPHIQVTAVSEDQTDNIWRVLLPMIKMGSIGADITDTGLGRINLRGGGIIEPVTASALSRLGQRVTYVEQDEAQSWTERNGGHKLADNQRRNLAGTGGRWSATGNAWDPSERSVMQLDYEAKQPGVFFNYEEPLPGSWGDKRQRRRILKQAYKGSPWVDIDRIEADCDRLASKGDPGQAERYFGNRVVAGASKAFDVEVYKALFADHGIEAGRDVTLGFDGAISQDVTGLVAVDIETGHAVVVAWWARPADLPDNEEWTVPIEELDEAVEFAFTFWKVWRMYADPPHYREDLSRWAGKYGADRVVEWWTNRRKDMATSLKEFRASMREGVMSHGPLNDSPEAREAHAALVEHVANSVKRITNMRDDEDGTFLWLISKDGQKSPRKIDLAMASCLAWVARQNAIRAGVLNKPKRHRAAGFR